MFWQVWLWSISCHLCPVWHLRSSVCPFFSVATFFLLHLVLSFPLIHPKKEYKIKVLHKIVCVFFRVMLFSWKGVRGHWLLFLCYHLVIFLLFFHTSSQINNENTSIKHMWICELHTYILSISLYYYNIIRVSNTASFCALVWFPVFFSLHMYISVSDAGSESPGKQERSKYFFQCSLLQDMHDMNTRARMMVMVGMVVGW